MNETILNILSGISSSLLTTLPLIPASIGFYIALRCVRFPDLTVEGSFLFGAVISAAFIQEGYSPIVAIFFAILGGMFCGYLTAFWHIGINIPQFVSGIITTFIFTSINFTILKILANHGEMVESLMLNNNGIFGWIINYDNNLNNYFGQLRLAEIIALLILVTIIVLLVFVVLKSKKGLLMRAFGAHRTAGCIYDKKYYSATFFGLAFSNALVAISGTFVAQYNKSVDLSTGATLLIPLLAAVVFGEFIVDYIYTKKIRKNKPTKPLLSRPLGIAFAPFIGFLIFNIIVLLFGAIFIPMMGTQYKWLDSYHKYWIIALFILLILAIRKTDKTKEITEELI